MNDKIKLLNIDVFNSHYTVTISVDGIIFKRIQDRHGNYPPVWNDVYTHFGQIDLCSKEKEKELESIFQALNPQIQDHLVLPSN